MDYGKERGHKTEDAKHFSQKEDVRVTKESGEINGQRELRKRPTQGHM